MMFETMRAMSPYLKVHRRLAITATVMTVIFALLALVDPYMTGVIIDAVLKGEDSNQVVNGVLIIIGVTLIRSYFRYNYFLKFERLSQEIVYDLRKDLYRKLQSLDFSYFDKTPNGQIMSKMTGDVEAIRHFYAWLTHVSIFHMCIFVFAIISMLLINPILCGSLVILAPFIVWVSFRLAKNIRPAFMEIREQFARLNTVVQENISGNRIVKAFARETYEIEKFDVENEKFREANMYAAKVREKNLPALEAFAALFNVVVLGLGGVFVIRNMMTVGELVAFNRLLWMINNPLRMIGPMTNGVQNFIASYERVSELLNEGSELKAYYKPLHPDKIEGYISFDRVSFRYEDQSVLEDISFEVAPGQTLALIGATGAGKSTLTSLITRFYDPDEGGIYIDHKPLHRYDVKTLRQNISVAMQDIFLFSDTIEGNITYGVPNVSPQKIRMAAEIAGVNDFIYNMDDDFNTVVGERGVGLSGGQKQRIALARAIIEDPSILILDDTTSAVDMETEYKILTELKKVNAHRTTIIIAHRISSVKDADQILVMDKGRIIERGTHDELLAKKAYYYDVFTTQMGEFNHVKEGA